MNLDGSSLNIILFFVIISAYFQPYGAKGEVFTAISHLKTLVNVEKKLTGFLKSFIVAEETRLERIARIYNVTENLPVLNFTTQNEVERFVGNPIQSLSMMKRVAVFRQVEHLIEIDFSKGEFDFKFCLANLCFSFRLWLKFTNVSVRSLDILKNQTLRNG